MQNASQPISSVLMSEQIFFRTGNIELLHVRHLYGLLIKLSSKENKSTFCVKYTNVDGFNSVEQQVLDLHKN